MAKTLEKTSKNGLSRINFMGFDLDLFDFGQIDQIKAGDHIISLNAENFVIAKEDKEFERIIQSSELTIPDGSGIVLGVRLLLNQRISKVAGIDLAKKLIEKKNRIAFLGSSDEVINILKEKYRDKLVYAHNGYFATEQEDEIAKKIQQSKPELLLVGLGAPKQEKFIHKYKKNFSNCIQMSVGGTLDVLSGKRSRAPKFFIALHLEWLYRMLMEPFRIKRIFMRVPKYLFFLLRYMTKG